MPRKRLISPEFFTHGALYDAEAASGLPLRLAFAGLWTACDRRGTFSWKPRELKLAILPYDPVDFDAVLSALRGAGFIGHYVVDGKEFGHVPSLGRWQTFHKNENPSDAPNPPLGWVEPANGRLEPENGRLKRTVVSTVVSTGTVAVADAVAGSVDAPAPPIATMHELTSNDEPAAFSAPFGDYAREVEGLIRSSRSPSSVMGVLRTHLEGNGEPQSTYATVGRAVREYLASGEQELKAAYFAGFVRAVGKGREKGENRRRNTAEQRTIDHEADARTRRDTEAGEAETLLETFAGEHPERYEELQSAANASVPKGLKMGRDAMVRGSLITLVRGEMAHS